MVVRLDAERINRRHPLPPARRELTCSTLRGVRSGFADISNRSSM
jgi:hypothetical protein